jgi:hypothetical protein
MILFMVDMAMLARGFCKALVRKNKKVGKHKKVVGPKVA